MRLLNRRAGESRWGVEEVWVKQLVAELPYGQSIIGPRRRDERWSIAAGVSGANRSIAAPASERCQ